MTTPGTSGAATPDEEPQGRTPAGSGGTDELGLNQFGRRENLLGFLSAVIGVLTVCCSPCLAFTGSGGTFLFDFAPGVAAIVLGILHLRRVSEGRATNRSLAVFGIVLGVIGVVVAICLSATSVGTSWHNDIG